MQGYINSFESFGTKDGPGIRFVVFMQGCPLRCLYCHNVDTWELKNKNYIYTPEEILAELNKVRAFLTGGITASGGEPLFQASFILELFKLCKKMEYILLLILLVIFLMIKQKRFWNTQI